MISSALERELHDHLEHLPLRQQQQVLDFARVLASARPRGVAGSELLRFAGTIETEDLKAMSEAIAQGCETPDIHEW